MDDRIIRMKLDHIQRSGVVARWPIGPWQARTADYLAPGEYRFDSDWAEVAGQSRDGGGESFWPAGKTLFLRATAETPPGVPTENLHLQFDAEGLEGLLSINGRPYAGIDAHHLRVVAPRADRLALEAEFICLLASLHRPELRRERARLREVTFVQVDPEIEAAYFDLWFTWEASQHAKDARRKQLLHAALEAALLAVDLTAKCMALPQCMVSPKCVASPPGDTYRRQIAEARGILFERIAAIAPDPEAGRIYLTGHSHIDTAWLWPLRETVRKCSRTFATACRLMERYPDYHFSCSQPQLYAYTRQHYPALYEEIVKWVATGRWECTGGMWVESDCNVPSGEALIRQILHGLRFFRQEFAIRPHSCWLPDVFGYPASLPQILKGCGLESFFTTKLHWQARNAFPMHLFWWEGIDGTRVLAHIPLLKHNYNGWPNPEQLNLAWDDFAQKATCDELLFPFGFGDGGGGPTEEMLEFAGRATAFPGLPATRQGGGEAYFDAVRAAAPDLPTWVGELYLETHRGTYTTHGEIKRANRKNELLLCAAEIAGFMAEASGVPVDLRPLDAAWENLLLLQFHDILPGSSIGEVYREAAVDHAHIAATARGVRDAAWRSLAEQIGGPGDLVAFNSLSWPRSDVATALIRTTVGAIPCGCPYSETVSSLELVTPEGRAVPAQIIAQRDGQAEIVFAPEGVPATGYVRLAVRPAAAPAETSLRVSRRRIENRFFLVELSEDGNIVRLVDRRHDREVVPSDQRANPQGACPEPVEGAPSTTSDVSSELAPSLHSGQALNAVKGQAFGFDLQLFQDGPEPESAWNIHATYEKRAYAWDPGTTLEVIETGPVRAVVRVVRRYRASRIEQDVILYDRVPRIDFVTRADWQERQVMLKAAFPVAVRSARATFEIQFGAVERPTHRNTSWDQEKYEVCGHRWADLSEAGYGISLLNDCKYGHDVHGNVLRLTLLRGPESPDPDADRGHHEFIYSLLPHAGDWVQAETVRRAYELNVPIVCIPCTGSSSDSSGQPHDRACTLPPISSFFEVTGPAILETIKPADDGDGWILRLYEPNGGRGTVTLRSLRPWRQVLACNLVEEGGRELAADGQTVTFPIGPFEIVALRVRSHRIG